VPDGAGAVGDHPEGAAVQQAGGAAVDRGGGDPGGGIDGELDELAVRAEVERGALLGADRLVDRVVDPRSLVGEQPGEVLGAALDPLGVVLDEQSGSPFALP
jgi:hypothetical protein